MAWWWSLVGAGAGMLAGAGGVIWVLGVAMYRMCVLLPTRQRPPVRLLAAWLIAASACKPPVRHQTADANPPSACPLPLIPRPLLQAFSAASSAACWRGRGLRSTCSPAACSCCGRPPRQGSPRELALAASAASGCWLLLPAGAASCQPRVLGSCSHSCRSACRRASLSLLSVRLCLLLRLPPLPPSATAAAMLCLSTGQLRWCGRPWRRRASTRCWQVGGREARAGG